MARATSSAALSTVTISPLKGSVRLAIRRVCAWPGRPRTPSENVLQGPRRPAPAAFYLGERQSGPCTHAYAVRVDRTASLVCGRPAAEGAGPAPQRDR